MQFAAFRRHEKIQLLTAGVAISALVVGASASQAAECGDLAGKVFGPATITGATTVSPPSSLLGRDPPTPVAIKATFCRVQGVIKPSADSDIKFEVWLPPESAWNARYRRDRQWWLCGSLLFLAMASSRGRRTPSRAPIPAIRAARWMRPGRLATPKRSPTSAGVPSMKPRTRPNPYRRLLRQGCQRILFQRVFGRGPRGADGGPAVPQGLRRNRRGRASQRLDEFDDQRRVHDARAEQTGAWLSPDELALVSKAAQRPARGGWLSGRPGLLAFDPSTLVCKSGQNEGCLTEAKLDGLKAIYAGTKDASGKLLIRGYPVGGEAGPVAWSLWITGTGPGQTKGSLMNGFFPAISPIWFSIRRTGCRTTERRWRLVCVAEDGRGA